MQQHASFSLTETDMTITLHSFRNRSKKSKKSKKEKEKEKEKKIRKELSNSSNEESKEEEAGEVGELEVGEGEEGEEDDPNGVLWVEKTCIDEHVVGPEAPLTSLSQDDRPLE